MKKRFVSLLLAISMILSLMPVSAVTAFAESENNGTVTTVDSGFCGADEGGENLKWTLDNNGVLTISGSGAMKDYTWDENVRLDWYVRYKKDIRSVVLDNRITHIGDYAFDKCTNIESVRYTGYTGNAGVALPKSVTTIGVHAFSDTGVTGTLKLPDDLIAIGSHAFYHCGKLNGELKLPDTVKEIGGFAFNRCGFTGKLKLPASLENIGNDAFESCSGLTGKLTFPSKMNEIDFSIFHETGITEVVIPSSIKTVRDFAFDSCMNLKKVYLPTEIPKIYNRAFRGCDNVKFYYPAYKADWMTQTSKFLDSTLNADKDAVKPSEVNTWRPICYYVDVTFDAGSGKFQNGEQKHIVKGNENELYRTENLTEAMVTAIGTPKQSGYHFAGWSLKQNGSVDDVLPVKNGYMTIAKNSKNEFGGVEDGMTLYAVYTSAASVKINGIAADGEEIKAGKEHEFTLAGKENTDTGATVTLALSDSTNAKLEYYDSTTDEWQEVTDALNVSAVNGMRFRVAVPKNADDATVTLTAVVKDAKGHEIEDGGDSKTFKVNKYVNAKVTITDLDNTTVKAGEAQDFTVSVTPNDDANTGAKATITVSGANADAVEKIQYKDGETWKDVPGEGLSIDEINNTEFKLITKADANDGDVTITVTANKANGTEIDKKVAAVTVKKHENAAVTIDGLDGTTVKAGEAKEFTVNVTPNDDTIDKVTFGTTSGEVQWSNDGGNTWTTVPSDVNLSDLTGKKFRVVPAADAANGTVIVTVTAKKADGTEVAKKDASFTVTAREHAKVTIDGLGTDLKQGESKDFTVKVDPKDDSGDATIDFGDKNSEIQYKDGEDWKSMPSDGLKIDLNNGKKPYDFRITPKNDGENQKLTATVKKENTKLGEAEKSYNVSKYVDAVVKIDGLSGTVETDTEKEFTVTVTANDDAGKNVTAKAGFTGPAGATITLKKVQYRFGDSGEWQDGMQELNGMNLDINSLELPFNSLPNITYKLTVTFAEAGNYEFDVSLTKAAAAEAFTSDSAEVTVTKKKEPVTPGGGSTGGGENPGENPGGGSTGGGENPGENPGGGSTGDSGNTKPTPKPDEKPDRKIKIDGGIVEVNGKEVKPDEDGNITVKKGDEITVTVDKSKISDAQVFDQWVIKPDSVLNEVDPKSEKISFTMPAEDVTIEAMTRDASIEDDGPGILGTGALIATGVVGSAALLYQGHMLGTELYLRYLLPHGAVIPQNRAELAVLLWQDAENPEPVSTTLYSDISDEDSAIQQAARWAVENDLMEQLDADEHPDHFDPFVPVTFSDSIRAWKKAQELKKSVH